MAFLGDLSKDVISGLIGTLIGFVGKILIDFYIKHQKNRIIKEFFGFPVEKIPGKIIIVHSALFDESRISYNYPSCDMISARKIANLLEAVGKKEGSDFVVLPEANCLTLQGSVDASIYNNNLILLGGPKRNKLVAEVLKKSIKPRYDMYKDTFDQNVLYDDRTRHYLVSSRDETKVIVDVNESSNIVEKSHQNEGHDYGLIMSVPNPVNLEYGVLILAGIHGPGTVGAAHYISNKDNLQDLSRRRKGNIIQEVVGVDYDLATEQVIDVSII